MKPEAAPTLLVGIGAAGGRVTSSALQRLEGSGFTQAGGIAHFLLPPGDQDLSAIRGAAVSLTRQRTIAGLEEEFDLRGPGGRYVRLSLICAAALHEVDAERLTACLRAFYDLEHPAGACEILFLLDAADPENPDAVSPGARGALDALREVWEEKSAASRRQWTASPRARFLVTHPHRADSSRLDTTPGPDQTLSEYEETLASAIAAHIEPGVLHDALMHGPPAGAPFALFGWASDILPRDAILNRAADLLAADLLELTAQPDPHGGVTTQEAAQDSALEPSDRRRLLIRLLLDDRLKDGVRLGEIDQPDASSSHSLKVQQQVPATNWSDGPPRRWPAAIRALQEQAEEESQRLLPCLQEPELLRTAADEIADPIARRTDELIRRQTNGTAAAKALLERAANEMDRRAQRPEDVRFAGSDPSIGLEFAGAACFEDLWPLFEARCRSLPGWGGAITGGIFLGAIGAAAAIASVVFAIFAWIPAGIALFAVLAVYVRALNSTRRMGYRLLELLRSDLGRRLLDDAQEAAGTPRSEGVYQSVSRRLREDEIPSVDRFIAARRALIDAARANPPFAGPGGTDTWMLNAGASESLRRRVGEEIGDTALPDDARHLLNERDLFAPWRQPEIGVIRAQAASYLRGRRLENWNLRRPTTGDFARDLLCPADASEPAAATGFGNWVCGRMDHLARRAAPLALLPSIHGWTDDGGRATEDEGRDRGLGARGIERESVSDRWGRGTEDDEPGMNSRFSSVMIAAPASLQWSRAAAAGAGQSDENLPADELPTVSAAADLGAWMGAAGDASRLITEESDVARCMVVLAGLEPTDVIAAMGAMDRNSEQPEPVRKSENGKGRAPHPVGLASTHAANGNHASVPEPHTEPVPQEAGQTSIE